MWTFDSGTGAIAQNGCVRGYGYAGHGVGKNNPVLERVANVGPIPRGEYTGASIENSPKLGVDSIALAPKSGTDTHGRGAFFWHGENPAHPGESSEGCIVSAHWLRWAFWQSGDHDLTVIWSQAARAVTATTT
ncbi:MAG TPA: tlde1 domain-containing protein [Candidatus Limnocylindrales bacterium]|nr:tlde1 domain-containing protein [Candidatus Limnocylindrales bacterium]